MLKTTLFTAAALVALCGITHAQDNHALDYVVQPGNTYGDPTAQGAAQGMATPWTATEHQVPTLDYNYYYPVPGGYATPARLYQSPRPVPTHVGYTYITYQPFAPHEFLYKHRAAYYTCYPGGVTVTRVSWGTSCYDHMRAFHPH